MFPRTLLIQPCLALAACAQKAVPPVPPTVDFVTATLGQAAEQAHGELALLARLRGQGLQQYLQHRQQGMPPKGGRHPAARDAEALPKASSKRIFLSPVQRFILPLFKTSETASKSSASKCGHLLKFSRSIAQRAKNPI